MDSLVTMEDTADGIRISVDDKTKTQSQRFIMVIDKRFAKILGCYPNQYYIRAAILEQHDCTWRNADHLYHEGLGHCLQHSRAWKSQKMFNEWFSDALSRHTRKSTVQP